MTTRRDVLVGIGAGLAIAPLPLIAGPVGAQGARPPIRLHALIVGINAYGGRSRRENGGTGRSELVPIKSLRGCLNDARAIETAVRPIAASVRLLTETQATRAAFLAAWREAVAGANSGDTILLTFSGHGGLESERRAADKPTGHNPALLFHGFDVTQTPNQADRVVSYEIKDMVQAARDKGVRVVFVADCCHAGTLTRSLDAAVVDMVTYRTIGNYGFEATPVGSVIAARGPEKEVDNMLYFSACLDNEVTPEVQINGQPHGAMSVAFARAIAGLAATGADGAVTGRQLQDYVYNQVQNLTETLQHSKVIWPTPDARRGVRPDEVLFYTNTEPAPAGDLRGPPVRLAILNLPQAEAERLAGSLVGTAPVAPDGLADLTWDAQGGHCTNGRDRIASGVPASALQAVVDRAKAVEVLKRLTARTGGLQLRLLQDGERVDEPSRDGGRILRFKEERTLAIARRRFEHLVVFNMTGTGKVSLLYPVTLKSGPDPRQLPVDGPGFRPRFDIRPPFGSDHIVAVASAAPADALVEALKLADGSLKTMDAMAAVEQSLDKGEAQIGFLPSFTGP